MPRKFILMFSRFSCRAHGASGYCRRRFSSLLLASAVCHSPPPRPTTLSATAIIKTRNGGEGQERMDDVLAVVSGWFSDKRALPAEWKKELDAMYVPLIRAFTLQDTDAVASSLRCEVNLYRLPSCDNDLTSRIAPRTSVAVYSSCRRL